jgi:hypothetical protein
MADRSIVYLPPQAVGSRTSSGDIPDPTPLRTMTRTYLPREWTSVPHSPTSEGSVGTIPANPHLVRRYLPPREEHIPSWGIWGTAKRLRRMHQQRYPRGGFEEGLHWAHSANTESGDYQVQWDPTENRRTNVISRMERRTPTMAVTSQASCEVEEQSEEELQEITSAQFRSQAPTISMSPHLRAAPFRMLRRGKVPTRPQPPALSPTPESSGDTSSEEYVPTRPDQDMEEEDIALEREMLQDTEGWEPSILQEEPQPEEEPPEEEILPGPVRGTTPDIQAPSPEEEQYEEDEPIMALRESPQHALQSQQTTEEWAPHTWPATWRTTREGRLYISEEIPTQQQWMRLHQPHRWFHQFGEELPCSFARKTGRNRWIFNEQRCNQLGIQEYDPRLSYLAYQHALPSTFAIVRRRECHGLRQRQRQDFSTVPTVEEGEDSPETQAIRELTRVVDAWTSGQLSVTDSALRRAMDAIRQLDTRLYRFFLTRRDDAV